MVFKIIYLKLVTILKTNCIFFSILEYSNILFLNTKVYVSVTQKKNYYLLKMFSNLQIRKIQKYLNIQDNLRSLSKVEEEKKKLRLMFFNEDIKMKVQLIPGRQ